MYDKGQGVQQNYVEALKWYRLAAETGNSHAQDNLGLMYANGHGVQQDYVSAYMWLDVAAALSNGAPAENRDDVAKLMTPDQIAEARRLARGWCPDNLPPMGQWLRQ